METVSGLANAPEVESMCVRDQALMFVCQPVEARDTALVDLSGYG
jgi:hypothetical protein